MQGLISPPASAVSPAPSHGSHLLGQSSLPTPRQHALRAGSEKEIALINYLDGKMLRMSRRYGKKFTEPENESSRDDAPGYTNMDQVVADLDPLVDVAWVSGTRKCFIQRSKPESWLFASQTSRSPSQRSRPWCQQLLVIYVISLDERWSINLTYDRQPIFRYLISSLWPALYSRIFLHSHSHLLYLHC